MNEGPEEELPPELRAMLTRVREAPRPLPVEVDLRAQQRLSPYFQPVDPGKTGGGAANQPATGGLVTGKGWLMVTGTAVGLIALWGLAPSPPPPPPPALAPQASLSVEPPALPADTGLPSASAPALLPVEALPLQSASARPPRLQDPSASTPAQEAPPGELELLQGARAALGRKDADAAAQWLQEHRRLYPRGFLKEEREALHVRLLALQGKEREASEARKQFLQEYPKSILEEIVRQPPPRASSVQE